MTEIACRTGRTLGGTALLVSADRPWLAATTAFLAAATRALSTAENESEALESAMRSPPDVAVVAPPLGGGSALALMMQLSTIRETRRFGLVYVTERNVDVRQLAFTRLGVNDWFPRGLPTSAAADRIKGLIDEIRTMASGPVIRRGPLAVDMVSRRVYVSGMSVHLSEREFAVLAALVEGAGRMLSREELLSAARIRRGRSAAQALTTCVEGISSKLGVARGLLEINTRHGFRLRFVAPP